MYSNSRKGNPKHKGKPKGKADVLKSKKLISDPLIEKPTKKVPKIKLRFK